MGVAPSRPFEPNNGIVKWVDRQLPIFTVLHGALVAYPTPKNLNYWWSFGSIAGLLLVVQIITGIVLAMHYTPHALMAFDSVEHIMRDVNYGWLLRYVHANGAPMTPEQAELHPFIIYRPEQNNTSVKMRR